MGEKLSMSVSHGEVGNPKHNLVDDYRKRLENVVPERTPLNEVLVSRDLSAMYAERFGASLVAYNERQREKGHPERQIADYLAHIRESKQEKPEYELVVQIGNMDTNPASRSGSRKLSAEVYRTWLSMFMAEFPNLDVHEAVIHNDEATPHLHVKYVPFSTGNKRGLETKNSLSGAHRLMGYATTGDVNYRMMKLLEEAGAEHGVERLEVGTTRGRLSVERYKAALRRGDDPDYAYRNDPALIAAVLELQETVEKQQEIIEDYHRALVEASNVKITNAGSVRAASKSAIDRNASVMEEIRERMRAVRSIWEQVKRRASEFVLNPVPGWLRDAAMEAPQGRADRPQPAVEPQPAAEPAPRPRPSKAAPTPKPQRRASLADDARSAQAQSRARAGGRRAGGRSR